MRNVSGFEFWDPCKRLGSHILQLSRPILSSVDMLHAINEILGQQLERVHVHNKSMLAHEFAEVFIVECPCSIPVQSCPTLLHYISQWCQIVSPSVMSRFHSTPHLHLTLVAVWPCDRPTVTSDLLPSKILPSVLHEIGWLNKARRCRCSSLESARLPLLPWKSILT